MKRKKVHKFKTGKFINKRAEIVSSIVLPKLLYTTLAINLILLVCVVFLQSKLPPEVPIFYGLAEGADQLSTKLGLLSPALMSLIISLVNLLLSLLLESQYLKKALVVAAFSVSALSLLTTMEIVLLIGNF